MFLFSRCLHWAEVMAEIAWSSVKIKRPLFPGTLNYSVLARDRGRESEGERGIWMWLLTLRKLSFFSKSAGSLFSEVESMAEKENKQAALFPCERVQGSISHNCSCSNVMSIDKWWHWTLFSAFRQRKCNQADEINCFSLKKWIQLNNVAELKHT